jgi:hypothetical protein
MRATTASVLGAMLLEVVAARAQTVAQGHCVPDCGPGYVCALDGSCVRVNTSDTVGHSTDDLAVRQQSAARVEQARQLLRLRLEFSYQAVSVESSLETQVYGLSIGLRKQLKEFIGITVQAGGSFGSMQYGHPDNSSIPSSGKLFEGYVELLPSFGPFGRFYAAPAALMGYRGYSVSRLDVVTGLVELRPKWLHEIGGRLGLLLLDEQRLDLSIQATSWPAAQTPYRFMGAAAIEFF